MKTDQPFRELSLSDQIQRAQNIARQSVLDGIAPDVQLDDILESRVCEIVGHDAPPFPCGQEHEHFDLFRDSLAGAYALGIAVGLQLRPEAFAAGGAR